MNLKKIVINLLNNYLVYYLKKAQAESSLQETFHTTFKSEKYYLVYINSF